MAVNISIIDPRKPAPLEMAMFEYGTGHCTSLGIWDGRGTDSVEDCKNLCLEEPKCRFIVYYHVGPMKSCKRYNQEQCPLRALDEISKEQKAFRKGGKFRPLIKN